MKLFASPRRSQSWTEPVPFVYSWIGPVAFVLACAFCLVAGSFGQTTVTPISSFVFLEANNTSATWTITSASTTNSANGNVTNYFSDGGGNTSTAEWTSAGALVAWTINYAGYSQTLQDAASLGQPGSFVITNNTMGAFKVTTINYTHSYNVNNNLLQPAMTGAGPFSLDLFMKSFTYGSSVYSYVSSGVDYLGRAINVFTNTANSMDTCTISGSVATNSPIVS